MIGHARRVVVRSVLVAAGLLAGTTIPGPLAAQGQQGRDVLNVLFIGNSQTFSNNLGDIVAGIAAADPLGPIIVPTMTNETWRSLRPFCAFRETHVPKKTVR